MKNILWLVSWYPNRYSASEANFIQRQARAVALYANIHVLYIHPVEAAAFNTIEEETRKEGNLTEQIIYYPSSARRHFLGKLQSINAYRRLSRKYVEEYIQKNGKPHYVHVQVPVRAGTTALWLKRKYGLNYALTEHYGIYNREVIDPFEDRSLFYRRAVKRMIDMASPFICVSRQLGEDIHKAGIQKDFISIPNVVNTELFRFQQAEPNRHFRFLHVSNMIPLKNVEGIIEAAKLLIRQRTDFELYIVGKYPVHIMEKVRQSGLLNTHIYLTGEIPYGQVAQEMQQADTFILFSRSESSSCVVQEALCTGLPVISTPVGIALESINDANGLFAAINDNADLSDKMSRMMGNRGKYNRAEIATHFGKLFSYEVIGKQIADCYPA